MNMMMMSSALPLVASSSSSGSAHARPPPITASVSCPIQKSTVPVANYAAETTHLTLSMEKLLENAEATGELRLCCRNLKMFPKNCCKFHLEDTVMTGKLQARSFHIPGVYIKGSCLPNSGKTCFRADLNGQGLWCGLWRRFASNCTTMCPQLEGRERKCEKVDYLFSHRSRG